MKIFLATDDADVREEFREVRGAARFLVAAHSSPAALWLPQAGFHLQLYGDSLLSVEGPIVHSGLQHGGVDEHNRPPSLLAHQKVPHRACACL